MLVATLPFPAMSVILPAGIFTLMDPLPVGVSLTVETVLLTLIRSLKEPSPETLISSIISPVTASLAVIDKVNWESFVVEPLATAVPLLLAAVIVAVGLTLS